MFLSWEKKVTQGVLIQLEIKEKPFEACQQITKPKLNIIRGLFVSAHGIMYLVR